MLSTRCVIVLHDENIFCTCNTPCLDLIYTNIILNFILKAFNLCCGEAYARFSELKRLKVHPGNMTKERDAVSS